MIDGSNRISVMSGRPGCWAACRCCAPLARSSRRGGSAGESGNGCGVCRVDALQAREAVEVGVGGEDGLQPVAAGDGGEDGVAGGEARGVGEQPGGLARVLGLDGVQAAEGGGGQGVRSCLRAVAEAAAAVVQDLLDDIHGGLGAQASLARELEDATARLGLGVGAAEGVEDHIGVK
jgi:hypothetical protein